MTSLFFSQQPICTDYDLATERGNLTGCQIFVIVDWDGDGEFSLEDSLDWFDNTCGGKRRLFSVQNRIIHKIQYISQHALVTNNHKYTYGISKYISFLTEFSNGDIKKSHICTLSTSMLLYEQILQYSKLHNVHRSRYNLV